MRVLVTGGAGFLGSHLSDLLLARGHSVICMDNLVTGNVRNLEHLAGNENFKFIRQDVTEYLYVAGPLDAVLHFASPASPFDYAEFPIQTLKVGALGTHKALGLAREKKARFLLASTSEVYGDPLVHPQTEDYWGNVNPIGPRGVYDEAKRFAEALTFAYHRAHGIETRIARIFNSVLADQAVLLFNDEEMHLEPVGEYAQRVQASLPRRVLVPAFNPETLAIELREATALVSCSSHRDAFEVRLRYGRSVKVTGDHSVFVRGPDGRPLARPVRELRVGDHVAIPGRLPVVERDRAEIDLARELSELDGSDAGRWEWQVRHPAFSGVIAARRDEVAALLTGTGRYGGSKRERNTVGCTIRRWMRTGALPLFVVRRLGLEVPADAEFAPYPGRTGWLPNRIELSNELLWTAGLYLAEGSEFKGRGAAGRAPSLYAHSKALHGIFTRLLQLRERRVPAWVMQLPLSRVKHFLDGYRCGDGTHGGKKLGNELCFDTTSQQLAVDLTFLLLRFGIVASLERYETTFRLTVCALDNFDVLSWDAGVRQTLNASRAGDLVWSQVLGVERRLLSERVYDFSVPGSENFVAGTGVCCHNTYGPRMRPRDGRVVPTFIVEALKGEDVTIFGDGSQTRSFCYVADMVAGLYQLLISDVVEPVNVGNPEEMTILEFARRILNATGGKSRIRFLPLPEDDPKVRQPDIRRARELLKWEPKTPLDAGLVPTVEYFRSLGRAEGWA